MLVPLLEALHRQVSPKMNGWVPHGAIKVGMYCIGWKAAFMVLKYSPPGGALVAATV